MAEQQSAPGVYAALAYTVAGASHLRAGIPNQDAKAIGNGDGTSVPLVLAVADGHGSARCPRSDRGSRFAVDAAVQHFQELLPAAVSPDTVNALVYDKVVPAIVGAWRRAVEADLLEEPIEGAPGAPPSYLAYGSTLLVAALCADVWIFAQLGDGDMLLVAADGTVSPALPDDPELLADVTTSLCQMDCERRFRIAARPRAQSDPALVQLSTDGYVNSFQSLAGFERTALDHLALLREHGPAILESNMEQWLKEITEGGSGDDVTVGILVRKDQRSAAAGTPSRVEVS